MSKLLESLHRESDINKWRLAIYASAHKWPTRMQRIVMYLDRGELGYKSFETWAPRFDDSANSDLGTRYLSAWLNNAVMTWGGRRVFLSPDVVAPVASAIQTHYSQVLSIVRSNFGTDFRIQSIDENSTELSERSRNQELLAVQHVPSGPIAGIDVGNTSTKLVIIWHGKIIFRKRIPTFPGKKVSLERLLNSLTAILTEVQEHGHVTSIGIGWFGDVRNGRPLLQSADLKVVGAGDGTRVIREFFDKTARDSVAPIYLYSDSEALGRALPALWPQPQAYVLIFGTSLGGAYVDANGAYATGLNLIGRVVVDMSRDALPHAETGVRGVAQQYMASRGLLLAIQSLTKVGRYSWLRELRPDKENAGKLLQQLLGSPVPRERIAGRAIVRRVARWVAALVMVLGYYYDVTVFGLTGTSMQEPVGRAIIQATQAALRRSYGRSDIRLQIAPVDPVFGVAIGAAYGAAAEHTLKTLKHDNYAETK